MAIDRRVEMSDEETDAFLGAHETGVLSLARGDDPHSIPISYGYDAADRLFYMRSVSTPDSEKRRFFEDESAARLVVYDDNEATYRSVIATGRLVRIDPDDLTVEDIQQYGSAKRPLFEIWPQPKGELDIDLYRLEPESVTGRLITVSRDP